MTKLNCERAREAMLIADLDELRGEADSELSAHIRTCARCRRQAETILQNYAGMGTALKSMATRPRVIPSRKPWRWAPLPLAAAAVLTLLLVRQQNDELPNVDAIARMMFQEAPLVAPRAGQQAMVIEQKDMTIVWLYNEEKL